MKICKKMMLSALFVTLLPGSFLFAQTRVMPSPPQGVEFQGGGTVVQQEDLRLPQQPPVIPPAVGSWAAFQAIPPEIQAIFDKAMGQQVGTTYTPMCVATQVVAGKNYRFYCFANTTTNPPQTKNAFVDIYVDPAGNVKEKKIADIERKNLMGGWTGYKPLDDKAKEIFAKTQPQAPKMPIIPLCVSTQVVAGTNYRFLCFCESDKGNSIRTVYVDLRGNVKETEFTPYQSDELQKLLQGEKPKSALQAVPGSAAPVTSQPATSQPSAPVLGQPRQQTSPQRVIVPRRL